jgi:hypothetical protein
MMSFRASTKMYKCQGTNNSFRASHFLVGRKGMQKRVKEVAQQIFAYCTNSQGVFKGIVSQQ